MRKIYSKLDGYWKLSGYGCTYCNQTFKTEKYVDKHIESCKTLNTLKKLKEDLDNMPVQRVMQDGKAYYRWGTQGKLYTTMRDAEEQGRAIYAQGYKETKKANK
jgi:hypothetical protein